MSEKKETILSKIFKPKKPSRCCSMEIVEEPDKPKDKNEKEEQAKNKRF